MKTQHRTRPVLVATAFSILAVLLVAGPAYADLWGADVPVLGGILSTLAQGVSQATQTLNTLKKTYDTTKQVAGYAEDAVNAYQYFSHLNGKMFSADLQAELDTAFPDIAYFRGQASNTGPWAQGSGELQRLLSLCFTGSQASCVQVQEVMTYQDTRAALAKTFGTAPTNASSMLAVDHEAAQAIRAGQAQTGRSSTDRALSSTWMKSCANADSSQSDNLAACQAAGASAQIEALKSTADVADQVAEGNRLSALQLEQRNEERKQALYEAAERHQILLDGNAQSSAQPGPITADGYNLLQEFGQ